MQIFQCSIPDSLYRQLVARAADENCSADHLAATILAREFNTPVHTLFEISMSSALVEGLYQGSVCVGQMLEHGDLGLGTFVDLDGEMVILDGICYQIRANGTVAIVQRSALTPYALVVKFVPDKQCSLTSIASFEALTSECDRLRNSNNFFYAIRIDGTFSSVNARVMQRASKGVGLREASAAQAEFTWAHEEGSLIGFWSPEFAGALSVPGYHFHYLSRDRQHGGHVLDCSISSAIIRICKIDNLHVSLPKTVEFMRADLSRDTSDDLKQAEQKHESA
jgi:acetolactate decarboxylase